MESTTAQHLRFDLLGGHDPFRATLRALDWSRTAIGHPERWPAALRTTYSLMLDSQFPMFLAWGRELTFLYNAAYVSLLDDKHPGALGSPMPQVWPELWDQVAPLVAKSFAGIATYGEDVLRTIRRNGRMQENAFTLSYSPIRGDDGAVAGAFCVISETTAHLRLESALVQADRRKDQFLAMLAHELRNPLAPISAAAELLKLAQLDPERVRSTGTLIARQVKHMTALVDDLLDVSRVTSGLALIEHDEVDIGRVISDALEQVRPLIETRQHLCVVHSAPGSAYVSGDYKRLVQVLANLLANAAKYTPQRGRIELSMETGDKHVLLRVADNGVGIPQDLLPHVFELFAQAERSTDRAKGGLGLALVKSLVELHGGSVAAASGGQHAGSTFTVRLPRVPPRADHDAPAAASATPAGSLRLLVVDDNVDAAQMLAMFLEASGHQAAVEHSAAAALARAAGEAFDACLLDIGLPGMDGHELARRLRAMPQTCAALLIAITGYGQQHDDSAALQAGFDHYMVKPVDPAAVLTLLAGSRRTS